MAHPARPAPTPFPAATPRRLRRPDGVTLACSQHGEGGQPVLFAHGFGQTRQAWGGSAQALAAAGFAALTLDSRGHGESDWNPPDLAYSMEQFADDLCAVADSFERPPILVGASMGGLLGLFSESRRPGLFRALVMVDVTPRWESAGVERILGFMGTHPDGFDDLDHAADAIATYLPHRQRKTPEQLRGLLTAGEDGRLRWHWDPRLLAEIGHGGERYQKDLVDAARSLRLPTLLVSGGRSDIVSERTVDEFLALVPHARHQRIDEATHMVVGDRNDLFTDTILDFLSTVTSSPASTGASP
ncbi:MAG: alpha/beta hydrolase [Lysobacteraceae bacterium]